jgi:hypothetical protein
MEAKSDLSHDVVASEVNVEREKFYLFAVPWSSSMEENERKLIQQSGTQTRPEMRGQSDVNEEALSVFHGEKS